MLNQSKDILKKHLIDLEQFIDDVSDVKLSGIITRISGMKLEAVGLNRLDRHFVRSDR